ncbi:MAG: bifunctional 5,10-methylene-tetrahydrofolate dehydrogenase/5,10-methylene-tetrahydrofolate cyclohydrolase [Treponema sp.]|jgi:methylenetetrahydrofolate dehydrogenase (NADP+)/methenyltetrahydrofolate cyclohydrolase|nr:bifunctional 5,10-methylene-tetrahydrofolate dehydrogenase/5,10-methylene-tetrahydrofolate cyclohydrolase [Treponema sp.]
MAIIIDGRAIAVKLREEVRLRAEEVKRRGVVPCLAVVLAGDDPASVSYVRGKRKALAEASMEGRDIRLPAEVSEGELLALVASLNADEKVHGILVQLPLPPHICGEAVIEAIAPAKDVDCFHPVSLGRLLRGQGGFVPCTPGGIVVLLETLKIPIAGSHAVVVGRSNIVGKPLAMLLAGRSLNATVTICHTGTKDLASYTRQADILIAAAGKPGLITGEMIKEGAAVIDVGVNPAPEEHRTGAQGHGEEFYHEPHEQEQRKKNTGLHGEKNTELHGEENTSNLRFAGRGGKTEEGHRKRRLVGDVVFDEASAKAGWITPVPGGVGPMTIAMLMRNVVLAAEGRL